ncbi:hypothetical protein [Methanovulcanius yangii]|uniref:hypothetical protein n=1 Tax=Methanovulcanius yangii TaxID=1789227 RepID=UPI0029C9C2E4|nr:hypothetical protein [Methanovulcanius yangii]
MRAIAVERGNGDEGALLLFTFRSISVLFDPDDPAPLPETGLTGHAEETLAGYLNEFRIPAPVEMIISLPAAEMPPDGSTLIPEAIRQHFALGIGDIIHEQRISRREGIYSLCIAIGNALIALLFISIITVYDIPIESPPIFLIGAFITIMNWVTIWDTYEHFLYDFRGIARRRRLYEKISRIPISMKGY